MGAFRRFTIDLESIKAGKVGLARTGVPTIASTNGRRGLPIVSVFKTFCDGANEPNKTYRFRWRICGAGRKPYPAAALTTIARMEVFAMKDNLEQCLDMLGISGSEYCSIINGLACMCIRDPSIRMPLRLDRYGWVQANAIVEKIFGNCTIRAEDRGPVYAVWINATADDGSLQRVLFFAEIPWSLWTSADLLAHLNVQSAIKEHNSAPSPESVSHFGHVRRSA
jgi:hypothetical protein